MTTTDPTGRVEHKIDALAGAVDKMNERLEGKIDALTKIVSTGFSGVDTRLTDVERQLVIVEDVAVETKDFSRNVWDSVTSLTQKVERGFEDAKKEREQGFDLVHKAIQHWGRRVDTLEAAPPRTTKRRR